MEMWLVIAGLVFVMIFLKLEVRRLDNRINDLRKIINMRTF